MWVMSSTWSMLGDGCQALMFLAFSIWFFIIALLHVFPGTFTTPIWAQYSLLIILILIVVGGAARLFYVWFDTKLYYAIHGYHVNMQAKLETIQESLEPIARLEKPMLIFLRGVEDKLETLEEALAGQLKRAKKQMQRAQQMTADGLKHVSEFAEEEWEELERGTQKCFTCGRD